MQLPNDRDINSVVPEFVVPTLVLTVVGMRVIPILYLVNIATCRQTGPHRNTDGAIGIRSIKGGSAGCQSVQIWRLINGIFAANEGIVVLVGENEYKVMGLFAHVVDSEEFKEPVSVDS